MVVKHGRQVFPTALIQPPPGNQLSRIPAAGLCSARSSVRQEPAQAVAAGGLLPTGFLSPKSFSAQSWTNAAASHLQSALFPSPRVSPPHTVAMSNFSCLSRSKWDVRKKAKEQL